MLGALSVPAIALRAACVGRSCDAGGGPASPVPFCGLPAPVRLAVEDGFREDRSPDVLAVTDRRVTLSGPTTTANGTVPWPSPDLSALRVPLVFSGPAVQPQTLPAVTLDRVAPTIADAIGLERPFPEVRSGTALPGVTEGPPPRLVLVVAWTGVGDDTLSVDPAAWPGLARLLREGAGTRVASVGSLPLEPAAVLATLGTGALPRQHGVTGPLVRDDAGLVVPAFGAAAPTPVLAALGDDLRDRTDGRVALVATGPLDLGVTGAGWYEGQDVPPVRTTDSQGVAAAVRDALEDGLGADTVPDLLAVVLDDRVDVMDRTTRRVIAEASRATASRLLVVVTATGAATTAGESDELATDAVDASETAAGTVADVVAGGLFLDQEELQARQVTSQDVVEALEGATVEGAPVFRDVFQGFAVSFNRFCEAG